MDFQIILVDTIHFNGLDTDVAADAVDFVDDVIAGLEVGKDVDFLAFGGMMAQAPLLGAEDIPFGDDDDFGIRQLEAVVNLPFDDVDAAWHTLVIIVVPERQLMLLHPGLERSPSVAAVDDEEDCIPQVPPMVHFFFQEVELLLETGHHLGGKAGRRVYHHIRHGLGHERQDELRPRALGCDQIFPGRQAALIVVGLLEDLLQAFSDAVRLDSQGNGQDAGLFPLVLGFLAVCIERAQAVQFVAEELQAQGLRFVDGIDIDDVAADGKMTAPFDHVDPFIAGVDEVLQQLVAVVVLMDGHVDSGGIDALRRHDVLGRFFRCRQDQEPVTLAQAAQGFHLPGRPVQALGRRRKDGLVDDREIQDWQVRYQKGQVRHPGRSLFPRRDDEDGLPRLFRQGLGDEGALDGTAEAVDTMTAGLGKRSHGGADIFILIHPLKELLHIVFTS